jgi:hypothetical protein
MYKKNQIRGTFYRQLQLIRKSQYNSTSLLNRQLLLKPKQSFLKVADFKYKPETMPRMNVKIYCVVHIFTRRRKN